MQQGKKTLAKKGAEEKMKGLWHSMFLQTGFCSHFPSTVTFVILDTLPWIISQVSIGEYLPAQRSIPTPRDAEHGPGSHTFPNLL